MFERLYDVTKTSSVSFVGYMTERSRYDFAIVYTDNFFGKPLVVCMQSGRSAVLCADDISNLEYLQNAFHLNGSKEAEELSAVLGELIPAVGSQEQY